MRDLLELVEHLPPGEIDTFVEDLPREQKLTFLQMLYDWKGSWARSNQLPPDDDWSTWVILAGRGFGKTRSGAEWVRDQVESGEAKRIALVARSHGDVRDVVVEGEAGILAVSPPWFRPVYEPSKRRITWPNGAQATTFTGEEPDLLRGPEHDAAWCDEIASWKYPETYDNLLLGLRKGASRCIITTTPKPVTFLRKILAQPRTSVSTGSTYENRANLSDRFFDTITERFEGTNLGRQELLAELLDQSEGALWTRRIIEEFRVDRAPEVLRRVVVSIDPAVTSTEQSDETGIVVVGDEFRQLNGSNTQHFYPVADASGRYTPDGWARRAVALYEEFNADRIVAEVNNGGDLVEATLRTVAPNIPFKAIHASRGKQARAEPVAALYEQGRVHHVGVLEELEDQLCNWVPNQRARSPDRLDAVVWAVTELMETKSFQPFSIERGTVMEKESYWDMR